MKLHAKNSCDAYTMCGRPYNIREPRTSIAEKVVPHNVRAEWTHASKHRARTGSTIHLDDGCLHICLCESHANFDHQMRSLSLILKHRELGQAHRAPGSAETMHVQVM